MREPTHSRLMGWGRETPNQGQVAVGPGATLWDPND